MRGPILGIVALVAAGCGGILPHESNVDATQFQSHDQLMTAYGSIVPGKTRLADLSGLGFGPLTTPNTEVLSYTQIVDRFMPSEAMTFQQVPPPVRACIEAAARCTAYLYRLSHTAKQRHGGVVPDLLGVERDTVNTGWRVDVVLLLEDDKVVYKLMSGEPNMESREDNSRPLGPLQDIGNAINPPAQ